MREFLLFGKGFTKVDQWQEGCWINVSDPNQDDFTYLEEMGVPESFISDIRDPNERPRVEKDDDWMLTIMRIPRETGDVDIPFSTVPLGVITNGDLVIVLCYFINYHNRAANDFSIDNCFIGDCSICSQRSFNVGFR